MTENTQAPTPAAPPATAAATAKPERIPFRIPASAWFFHVLGAVTLVIVAILIVRSMVDDFYVLNDGVVVALIVALLLHITANVLTWIYNIMLHAAAIRQKLEG